MPVTITWDEDAPITGQPDAGTNSKVYTEAGAGTVTIADEAIGGPTRTLNYMVPLALTEVVPDPAEIDSAGTPEERTTTVAGQGFPANASGTVAIATGAPDAYGTTIVSTNATTNASGIFTGIALTVPVDTDAGDYHIEAVFGSIGDLSAALTIVNTELAAPTNLASPAQTASTVDLTWDAVADAEMYVVRWAPTGTTNWTEQAPVATTSDTVDALTPETTYDFEVKATATGSTDSPWSATLTQATGVQPQLAAPTNPSPGTTTATEVPFSWDAVTDADTYTVAWREPAGTWTEIPDIAVTNHTVTGLDPLTEYELRVKAVADGFTDSDWSTVVNATTQSLGTLAAPANLASPAQTATTIDLTWEAVTNATMYGLEQSPAGAGTWSEIATVPDLDHTADGLTASTSYDFRVAARADGWTDSAWSTMLTQSTTA